jgi:hypothetical protein
MEKKEFEEIFAKEIKILKFPSKEYKTFKNPEECREYLTKEIVIWKVLDIGSFSGLSQILNSLDQLIQIGNRCLKL